MNCFNDDAVPIILFVSTFHSSQLRYSLNKLLSKRLELKPNTVITFKFLSIRLSSFSSRFINVCMYLILSAYIIRDCSNNHLIHDGIKLCESLNEKCFVINPDCDLAHDDTLNGINREFIVVDEPILVFSIDSMVSKS